MNVRLGKLDFFDVPVSVSSFSFNPRCQMSVLLSAAAELNEDYLEEVTLYALFRQAQQPKKKK